jgi:hypothetical protein
MLTKILRVAMPAALALTLIGAGPAHADTTVYANGTCSAASTWKLNLHEANGIVALAFKVQTAAPNEVWHVRVWHGHRTILRALKMTKDDGAFHLRLLSRNWKGFDLFHVRARDLTTRELCSARGVV